MMSANRSSLLFLGALCGTPEQDEVSGFTAMRESVPKDAI
jgi:hypothetical protein